MAAASTATRASGMSSSLGISGACMVLTMPATLAWLVLAGRAAQGRPVPQSLNRATVRQIAGELGRPLVFVAAFVYDGQREILPVLKVMHSLVGVRRELAAAYMERLGPLARRLGALE